MKNINLVANFLQYCSGTKYLATVGMMRNSKRLLDVELLDCGGWTGRISPRPCTPWAPLASICWTLTWWTTSSSFASHPASSCPCDTSLACCWAAACLWGWVYSDKLLEELTERLLMICWTICTMSTLDKTHANIMMKSKVFQRENILVLEDFSLPQLTFLKLVRLWIMTKDHSIGFLISLKLLINHH